jgi:aromatic ring-cleaving dioxygenase
VHVIFDDQNETSLKHALAFQKKFAETFNISTEVDQVKCDDSNTPHGENPPLCMIDNDWGTFNASTGHWKRKGDVGACPFLNPEFAVFLPVERYAVVVPWFMQHRPKMLDVVVHPNSGCEVYDHRDWAIWSGAIHGFDLTCLHYDCPGCNGADCKKRGEKVVLSGQAERCGLKPTASSSGHMQLELFNKTAFCTVPCLDWATADLPKWLAECPANCDFVRTDAVKLRECQAHASSATALRSVAQGAC